jgi:hydrogenase maturation factor HypF (carbamoyltransferase family)
MLDLKNFAPCPKCSNVHLNFAKDRKALIEQVFCKACFYSLPINEWATKSHSGEQRQLHGVQKR